jgi:hypothetical protein
MKTSATGILLSFLSAAVVSMAQGASAAFCQDLFQTHLSQAEDSLGLKGVPNAEVVLGRLTFIGAEGRSGRWFRDKSEIEWYVKPDEGAPQLQTGAEIISAEIYRNLFYDVPETRLLEFEGKRHVFSQKVAGAIERNLAHMDTQKFRQARFVAAYLKDWDRLAGMNTIALDKSFYFIDFGGTLGAKATGAPKPGVRHSPAIGSFEASDDISVVYGGFNIDAIPAKGRLPDWHPWRKVTREDAVAFTEFFRVRMTDEFLAEAVAMAHYSDPRDSEYMIHALKVRRDAMVRDLVSTFGHDEKPARQPSIRLSRRLMETKLFLVHATDVLPENGVIVSDQRDRPGFRPTTHFSLGELVRPHHRGSWEFRNYAVIVPYAKIVDQLVNILPQDTIALGDVKLPQGSVLVVPEGTQIPRLECCEVVEFDPEVYRLRTIVDQVIASRGGWNIHSEGGYLESPARFQGININSREFFAPLLNARKHLFYDINAKTELGRVDETILNTFHDFVTGEFDLTLSSTDLVEMIVRLERDVEKLDRIVSASEFPAPALDGYHRARQDLKGWIDILVADLEVRDQFKKTVLLKEYGSTLARLKGSPERLRQFMFDAKGVGPRKPTEETMTDLVWRLRKLNLNELENILKRFPVVAREAGGMTLVLANKAIALVEESAPPSQTTHLLTVFEKGLLEAKGRDLRWLAYQFIHKFTTPEKKRAFLPSPASRRKLARIYDLSILIDKPTDDGLERAALK